MITNNDQIKKKYKSKKGIVLLILSFLILLNVYSQTAIYKDDTGAMGWSWGADEATVKSKAYDICKYWGGKNPSLLQFNPSKGWGAAVYGYDRDNRKVWGVGSGTSSREAAIQGAINIMKTYFGSDVTGIYTYDTWNDVKKEEPDKSQSSNTNKSPEFGNWRKINSANCDLGIEYRTKKVVRYQLNYQLWYYYEVRNTSGKNIRFEFNLIQKGKVEFNHGHILSPGGIDEFMHKMDGDYIDGVSVTNVINTQTNKSVCEDDKSINQNSNSNNSNSSINDLLNKWNELCQKANNSQNPTVQNASNRSCLKTAQNFEDNASNRAMIAGKIKDLENAFATDKDFSNKEDATKLAADKAAEAEEERLKEQSKVLIQKTSDFTSLINEGDNELQNENYDAAISKYSQAKNLYTGTLAPQEEAYARDAIPLADARIAAAQKAKADAARKVRVAEKTNVEQKQNEATTAAIGGFAGIMAMVKDKYSNGKTAVKFQVGLGYGSLPMILNSDRNAKSLIKNSNQILFHLGFKLGLFNKKGVSFDLTPSYSFGLASYSKGSDGGSSEYGGLGTIYIGKKATSVIKLFAEGGYFKRTGTHNYDEDVAKGANSTTDNVEKGTFNYSVMRYGGGIKLFMLNGDGDMESYIKPAVYFEKASFFSKATKPVMVANVQCYIYSNALIDFTYSKNYFIPGSAYYLGSLVRKNANYFSIKIIRQGKLK